MARMRRFTVPAMPFVNECKQLQQRHALGEQSEISHFWYEKPTQGWIRIAGEPDRWEKARLFTVLNVAMADGFIRVRCQLVLQTSPAPRMTFREVTPLDRFDHGVVSNSFPRQQVSYGWQATRRLANCGGGGTNPVG
jgi:hypothetical protein